MRTVTSLLAVALVLGAPAPPVAGQTADAIGDAEIEAALEAHHAAEEADREAVRRVLRTPQVRRVAETLGADRDQLLYAADVVGGERLAAAAEHAREIESQLAGGQNITMTATTLIIILLLVVLVVLIAD